MMKILLVLMMFFFILNSLNKNFITMIYMNFMFFLFFFVMLMFPFNSGNLFISMNNLFMDMYSWGLIMLSVWIISLMILTSNYSSIIYFMMIMNFLLILLILCFSTENLILFYIYFESSLIPVFLLIMGWGYQVERIQASYYMMLYTLFGSMPLFIMIIYIYIMENSLMMKMIELMNFSFLIYLSLMMAFFIKMPMYFVHLWLPKAHVEAPVVGSMILAGVMLKLGGYGMIRVMMFMFNLCMKFNKFFMIISLMGGLMGGFICLCQVDMKMLVAYSSVVHMSIFMSGVMTLFNWGLVGGFMMMISHGLCSSGMFCLVNMVYERFKSRSLFINKGLINYFPSFSLMWFFLCSSNLSFPPSLNLFSEIMLFNSLLMWSKNLMMILILISFLSATYSLYLYSYSQHGKMNSMIFLLMGIKVSEFLLLMLHWIPLNMLFFIMILFL